MSLIASTDKNLWLEILVYWHEAGWIRGLDLAFARFLHSESDAQGETPDGSVFLLAALVSYQTGRGHVCLVVDELLTDPDTCLNFPAYLAYNANKEINPISHFSPTSVFSTVTAEQLISVLQNSSCVDIAGHEAYSRPLVLKNNMLYLRRYWQYEERISYHLQQRMQCALLNQTDEVQLTKLLPQLFPPLAAVNWQKLACALAVRSQFSVITGGPGTGKTYTVVRLLALLQRLNSSSLRIRLAAPTGKAAARLKESVQSALNEMGTQEDLSEWRPVLNKISGESSTLHRLLGVQPGTRKFRHHAANPLSLDVLIVDEASMIDIEMMDAVLQALPAQAQLILLGDKDQLASVEAGAILGQLCHRAEQGRYNPEVWEYLRRVSAEELPESLLDPHGPQYLQHVMMLKVSQRFTQSSGIGQLAQAVNQGDSAQLIQLLSADSGYDDINLLNGAEVESLQALCQSEFRQYLQAIADHPSAQATAIALDDWARHVLTTRNRFQILSPLREGVFGVEDLNQRIARWLNFRSVSGQWYPGRPVIVTENDYTLNLRNGDIGVALRSPVDNVLRVVFIDSDNVVRWILPSRLRQVETVFAMTVHKSQGSEFSHTVMVIPEKDSQVLSRELIYTGITRARENLTLVIPDMTVLVNTLRRITLRAGGLELNG